MTLETVKLDLVLYMSPASGSEEAAARLHVEFSISYWSISFKRTCFLTTGMLLQPK